MRYKNIFTFDAHDMHSKHLREFNMNTVIHKISIK